MERAHYYTTYTFVPQSEPNGDALISILAPSSSSSSSRAHSSASNEHVHSCDDAGVSKQSGWMGSLES